MSAVVLITGASRGIGAATALLAARAGYAVAVNYAANSLAADEVVRQIRQAGGNAMTVQADVADESQVLKMFEKVDAKLGRLTALVNNAGVVDQTSRVDAMSMARFKRMFEINVYGSFVCAREAVRRMSTRHGGTGGTIVNLGGVSAHVGDQFGQANKHLLTRVFGWFYFSINFGSFFSTLLTPWLLKKYGPGIAFGLPGILMALATLVFWLGRNRYIHIPAKGWGFVRETFSRDGLRAIGGLVSIYVFVAVFWALYDQTGSAWVLQAAQMNCDFAGIVWLESQIQAINPLLILIYIPIFSYLIYPFVGRFITLTPLRKIGAGLFLTVAAFSISALAQAKIDAAQEAFRAQVAPMVASDSIDFAKTTDKLKSQEHNATAQSIEKLLAEATPAGAAWQKSVSSALSVGGIAIAKDSTEHNADWPSIAWQIIAYLMLGAAFVYIVVS